MADLYLIRHGLAEERGEAWPDDTRRPLTERGMARLRKEADALDRLGVAFDVILTSPLVRARQTAEIVAAGFSPRPSVTVADALAPGGTHAALLTALEPQSKRAAIALVGHEPGLGELAARLVGTRRPIPFKKGAVCCIEVDAVPPDEPGTLRWFLTPKMLRQLRG